MYSDNNLLIYTNDKTVSMFSSEEEIHQGDPLGGPLGPALFSITIQHTLLESQKANPNVTCLAYLDDVLSWGQLMQLYQQNDLRSSFHQLDWKSKTRNVNCFFLPHQPLLMSHFLFQ